MKVAVEKRIGDIEDSLKMLARYMKDESTRLEDLASKGGSDGLSHEVEEIKKRLDEHSEPLNTDTDKKLQAEVSRLEGLIYSIPKEKALKEYSESMKVAEELKKSVDLRLQVIEGKLRNAAQDMVSSKLEEFQTLQDRFKRLDERVADAVSVLENLKGSMHDDGMKRLEKRLTERMDEIDSQLKKDDRSDSREYKKLLTQMQEFQDDFANKSKHFQRKEDLARMLNEIKGRFDDFESLMKKTDVKKLATNEDLDELQKELDEYRKVTEKKLSFEDVELDKMRKAFESDMKKTAAKFSETMQEMQKKVEQEAKVIGSLGDMRKMSGELMAMGQRMSELETSFDKRIASVENNRGDEQDVMDLRVDADDTDKRLVEIELSIKDLKKTETEMKKALDHVQNFDTDMKMEATKLLTSQLSEFAKHVDRRIPAVVTRDEFSRSMIEMNHRISTVETPDFSHFNRRMQALESRVNEIYELLRTFGDSLPVVVE